MRRLRVTRARLELRYLLFFAAWILLPGCLQQEDLSADALTSFEEATPGRSAASSGESGQPAGAAANAAIDGEGSDSAQTNSSAVHEEVAGEPAEHEHSAKPPGFGSDQSAEGSADAEASVEKVAGVPEAHEHKEMPPGYGSSLPAEPVPEAVPVPEGPGGGDGGGGAIQEARPTVLTPFERDYKDQKLITVSGEVTFEGEDGPVDIDCFVPKPDTAAGRKLVNKVKLQGTGPYSMKVPADYGPLIISGFIDVDQDGPGRNDPQGGYEGNPLEIKDKDIKDVNIVLKASTSSSK